MSIESSNCEMIKKPSPFKLKIPDRNETAQKPESEYTEVEKMMSSIPYSYKDESIINGRLFAKTMLRKINNLDPLEDIETRHEMFSQLLGSFF